MSQTNGGKSEEEKPSPRDGKKVGVPGVKGNKKLI